MQYGMLLGLYMAISLIILVSGNPTLAPIFPFLFISTPFLAGYFAVAFKKNVQRDGQVNYFRGLFFSFLLYMYATAILAIISFLYFQFLDHGAFIQKNIEMLHTPEVESLIVSPEMAQNLNGLTMKEIEEIFSSLTPATITAAIINLNVFLTIPLAIFTAFFAQTKKK